MVLLTLLLRTLGVLCGVNKVMLEWLLEEDLMVLVVLPMQLMFILLFDLSKLNLDFLKILIKVFFLLIFYFLLF